MKTTLAILERSGNLVTKRSVQTEIDQLSEIIP
jgi:hypothetical protein